MNALTFKERYTDNGDPRRKWIRKMLSLELDVSERQALRYLEEDEAELKGKTKEIIEKVLAFSEKTLNYKELVLVERLPKDSVLIC